MWIWLDTLGTLKEPMMFGQISCIVNSRLYACQAHVHWNLMWRR
jgi:hypothetical protein